MSDADKRKRYKAYNAEYDRVTAEREAIEIEHHRQLDGFAIVQSIFRNGCIPLPPRLPPHPPFPDDLLGMTCAAKTRAGTPCKLTSIYGNGRCKLHGGMSTGPRTDAGRKRSALNGNVPKTKRTP
jgi:hypothetical protein